MSVLDELKIKLGWEVDTKPLDKAGQDSKNLAEQTKKDWSKAGAALKTGFLAASAAIAAAAAAAAAFTNQMADQLNEVDKTSRALGMTAKEYQAMTFAMRSAGLEAASLKGGVEKFNAALNDARFMGSGPFTDSIRQMGMSIEDFNGLSVQEQLEKFADGFSKLTDQTEKTGIAQKVLTSDWIGLLEGGGAAIRGFTQEAEMLGLATDDQVAGAAKLKDSMLRLEQAMFGVKSTIAGELFPIFESSISSLKDWILANRDWLRSGFDEGMKRVGEFTSEAATALRSFWNTFGPVIKAIGSKAFETGVEHFRDLSKWLTIIKSVFSKVNVDFSEFLGYLESLSDKFEGGAFGSYIDFIAGRFQFLADTIRAVSDNIAVILDQLADIDGGGIELGEEGVKRRGDYSFIPGRAKPRVKESAPRKGAGAQKVLEAQAKLLRETSIREALNAGATRAEAQQYADAQVKAFMKSAKAPSSGTERAKSSIRKKYEDRLRKLIEGTGLGDVALDKALLSIQGQLEGGATEEIALRSGIGTLSGLSGRDLQAKYDQSNSTLYQLTGQLGQPDLPLSDLTRGTQPQVLTSIINNTFSFDNEFNINGSGDPGAVGESVVESFRTYFQEAVEASSRSVKVNFAR